MLTEAHYDLNSTSQMLLLMYIILYVSVRRLLDRRQKNVVYSVIICHYWGYLLDISC